MILIKVKNDEQPEKEFCPHSVEDLISQVWHMPIMTPNWALEAG